jgi:hypothetical protein
VGVYITLLPAYGRFIFQGKWVGKMQRSFVVRMLVVGLVVGGIGASVSGTRLDPGSSASAVLVTDASPSEAPNDLGAAAQVEASQAVPVSVPVGDVALSDSDAIPPLSFSVPTPIALNFPNATSAQAQDVFSAFVRARAAGVPNANENTVILSVCAGGTNVSHWGYYNNGANGGAVPEPDGAVVPLGGLCINPSQPDVYSTVLHELGHKYFWEHNLWVFTKAHFGGSERAAECFAKAFGATVFGEGGCSDADAQRMRTMFGW